MDQDERTEGAAMSAAAGRDDTEEARTPDDTEEARTPEAIRTDIEQTREEVGDTVEALAAKTDVKAQAHARVDEVKGNVRAKADEVKAKAQSSTPESAQQGGQQVIAKVRANPAPLVLGAAVLVAFLIGRRTARP
jgi:uncharacterized protein YdbL (DUF1318 family)